jgi:hypothetical protein
MFRAVTVSVALLSLLTATAMAQISLTATGGTPVGAYSTLKAAFDAINAGVHTGTITIEITGNTNETASAVLHGSGGPSSYTQIAIRPAGGAPRTVSGNLAGPLVDLDGADHVTIDGLGTGGNSLTLRNSSTAGGAGSGTGASALRLVNDATANRVLNLTLSGSCGGSPTAQSGVLYFGSASVTGNDDNEVIGCEIGPAGTNLPVNAIYALGNSTSAALSNSGVAVSNNRIHDFYSATGGSTGITVSDGNYGWTLRGNSFYQTAARTQSGGSGLTHYAIHVSNGRADAGGFLIVDNTIGGSAPEALGDPWSVSGALDAGFAGIHLSLGSAGSSVQNNRITNFAWSCGGDWRGIQIERGSVGVGTEVGNTIGAGSGTGAVVLTSSQTGRSAFGIDAASPSGAVTLSNNVIGSIRTAGTTTSISTSLIGIRAGASVVSIDHNTIGSATTPNSLYASTAATSVVPQAVSGIACSEAGSVSISDNLVANLRNAYAGSAVGGQVSGIVSALESSTIARNTVHDLANAAPVTAAGAGSAVIGIAQTSLIGEQDVSGNVVHSLSSSNATAIVSVVGILYAGPAGGDHRVARNIVHSLSLASASTGASLIGIHCAGGAATYQNNMVRLGLDPAGSPITTGCIIVGIVKGTVLPNRFYHNSVWIGGAGVAASTRSTCAFRRAAAGTDEMRDNIFVNARANAGLGGKHFAFVLDSPAGITRDSNIYQVTTGSPNLASLDGGATSIGTLQALRGAALDGSDANSGVGDPRFLAPADPAGSVSLKLQDPNAAEAAGVAVASVIDDQEGEARGALTPTDVGADAGLYSMTAETDIFTPHISYAPLTDTASRGDRLLTATLTDVAPAGGGVPASGSFRPRIWFKKSTDPVWALSAVGSLQSGDGRAGVWSFTIPAAVLLPEAGDEIEYYVVAQDQGTTPNLWYEPVGATEPIHADVNTQLVPPAAPARYAITASLYGTYYAPHDPGGQSGRVYSSLTRAGGFFAALGGLPVSGDLTLIVNGDIFDEDGSHALDPWQEVGAGGYTLTIRPADPGPRVLAGTTVAPGAPLIDIRGADRVAIDGRYLGGGQYLVLRNTNPAPAVTGATVRFDDGAAQCVLRNCIVENNGSTVTGGAVIVGSTGANDDLRIVDNDIREATAGTAGAPAHAIYADALASRGLTITDNHVYNWTTGGVTLAAIGGGVTVAGNSFYNHLPVAPATAQTAIFVAGPGDGNTIAGNFVGGGAPFCAGAPWTNTGAVAFHGIRLATAASVQGNAIRNIRMTSTGAATFAAIDAGESSGPVDLAENTIGDDGGTGLIEIAGDGAVSGIHVAAGPATAISVTGNTIANLTALGTGAGVSLKGIDLESGIGAITQNDIHDLTSVSSSTDATAACAVAGIRATPGTGNAVERNTVWALRSAPAGAVATVVNGILAGDGAPLAHGRAQRNRIYDLTNSSASPAASIRGLCQASNSASWTLANNQIALTNLPLSGAVRLAGIEQDGPGACSYNSICIGGSQTEGVADSYAYGRADASAVVLRDNLLFSDRVNGGSASGSHCAIANLASVWDGWSSDYDLLIAADPGQVGRFGATPLDFAGWRAVSGGEANSLSEPSGIIPAAALFTDAAAGDLDIRPTAGYDAPPIVSDAGTPLADQTTDFGGGDARGSIPDIGADEITVDRALSAPGDLPPASPRYPGRYDDVTVDAAGAPTLTGEVEVFGVLTLGGGNIVTGAYMLTIRPGGDVVRASGHIVGNLRKHVSSGTGVDRVFEVGTGIDYAPVALHFDGVDADGYLVATTVSGDHPELPSSPLDPARSVNRYWRLANEGVAFGSAEVTLNFVPTDVDGGATPDAFRVGKFDAPDWSLPAVGARTSTSISASGLTSFSDFAIAEPPGFTLTTIVVGGGTLVVDPNLPRYADGDSVTVTAIPDSAQVFDHWTGDAGGSENPLLVVMNANKTISGVFAYAARPHDVVMIAPNGGEHWIVGSTQSLAWTATDDVAVTAVDLDYSLDGGATYPYVIAHGLPNAGSYAWTVPGPPGQHARVRVTARNAAGSATADASDANFEILAGTQGVAEPQLGVREIVAVHPNPAYAGVVQVLYRLAPGARADIGIYDMSGRLTRRLASGVMGGGDVRLLLWDGCDQSGGAAAAGVYLVRISAAGISPVTRRLTLLR